MTDDTAPTPPDPAPAPAPRPKPEPGAHPVDTGAQEDAAEDRKDGGGYT